jgi:nucleotide-binding universal stress UspA family protein
MGKILIAVDGTAGLMSVLSVYRTMAREPDSVILVYVQRPEGKSVKTGELHETGLKAPRNSTRAPEHKEALDRKAEKILDFCKQEIKNIGPVNVKALVRDGVPSEEILTTAREEAVDLIIMGRSNKSMLQRLVAGCVAKEVERAATVPVLVAKTGGREKSITYGWRGESYAA